MPALTQGPLWSSSGSMPVVEEIHHNSQEHWVQRRLCQSLPHDPVLKQWNSLCLCVHGQHYFCVGHTKALKTFVEDLKKQGLMVKVLEKLTNYLSCMIKFSQDRKSAWVGQPHLIAKLQEKFGYLVTKMQSYCTPGTPGQRVVKAQEEWMKISREDQKLYQSAVGTLLYLVKYSRPCLANPLHVLSKALHSANQATFKELKHLIKFALNTADYGLKIKPFEKPMGEAWTMTVFFNSDYAGDT